MVLKLAYYFTQGNKDSSINNHGHGGGYWCNVKR
jgi:hypothetical protein